MILLFGFAGLFVSLAYLAKKEEIDEGVHDFVTENVLDYWTRFDHYFLEYGRAYGVNPRWLKAIALNESDLGRAKSVAHGLEYPHDVEGSKSSDGKSWGIMQVTLPTGGDYDKTITPWKLNDPRYSIEIAARFVRDLKKQFDSGDPRYLEWVIKSYNQGAGNTRKEKSGLTSGYTGEYWPRFQRNIERVNQKPGVL